MAAIPKAMAENALVADSAVQEALEERTSVDTAEVRLNHSSPVEEQHEDEPVTVALDNVLLAPREGSPFGNERLNSSADAVFLRSVARVVSSTDSAVPSTISREARRTSQQEEHQLDSVGLSGASVEEEQAAFDEFQAEVRQREDEERSRPVVKVRRDKQPLCEYTEVDDLYIGAFPHLFLLGEGAPAKGFSKKHDRVLMRHHSNKFQEDSQFSFCRFNCRQRAENVRNAKLWADNHPAKVAATTKILNRPGLSEQIQSAIKDPDGKAAKKLLKEFTPLLTAAGRKTAFSSAERNFALTQAYALCHRYGLPSWFFTFAPDVLHHKLVIRLTFYSSSNKGHPAQSTDELWQATTSDIAVPLGDVVLSESKLQALNAQNAAAASEVYITLLELVFKHLFGVPPAYLQRKSQCPDDFDPANFGVLGKPYAALAVTEVQNKLSLHGHCLFWGGVTPTMLQRVSFFAPLRAKLASVLESMCACELRPADHLANLFRKLRDFKGVEGNATTRASRFPSHQKYRDAEGALVPLQTQSKR